MRLKHVCARGKSESRLRMPFRQKRSTPLLPCSAEKPCTGTPDVPVRVRGAHAQEGEREREREREEEGGGGGGGRK